MLKERKREASDQKGLKITWLSRRREQKVFHEKCVMILSQKPLKFSSFIQFSVTHPS